MYSFKLSVCYLTSILNSWPLTKAEFDNREDLSGQQASKLVIPELQCALWWAQKELQDGKKLADYCGRNDRTKIIVKIQKIGQSAPAREAVVTEDQQKEMMARAYRNVVFALLEILRFLERVLIEHIEPI